METEERWQLAQAAYAQKIKTAARNSSYVSADHSEEDMEQELLVVLWECCSMYDPDRGASFNSFFWMRAKQRISRIRAKARSQKRSGQVVYLEDLALSEEVGKVLSAEDECLLYAQLRDRGGNKAAAYYLRRTLERYGRRTAS